MSQSTTLHGSLMGETITSANEGNFQNDTLIIKSITNQSSSIVPVAPAEIQQKLCQLRVSMENDVKGNSLPSPVKSIVQKATDYNEYSGPHHKVVLPSVDTTRNNSPNVSKQTIQHSRKTGDGHSSVSKLTPCARSR